MSYRDWFILINYLGGEMVAGNKMKSTTIWESYTGITNTNSSGFTGLPGGLSDGVGALSWLGTTGAWWSATGNDIEFCLYLFHKSGRADKKGAISNLGLSVRCIRD